MNSGSACWETARSIERVIENTLVMIPKAKAVTFDDFLTLRYPMKQRENIIYPILTALKRTLDANKEQFLKQYFKENQLYQTKLRKTLRETLLDDIVTSMLVSCDYNSQTICSRAHLLVLTQHIKTRQEHNVTLAF